MLCCYYTDNSSSSTTGSLRITAASGSSAVSSRISIQGATYVFISASSPTLLFCQFFGELLDRQSEFVALDGQLLCGNRTGGNAKGNAAVTVQAIVPYPNIG